MEGQEDAETSFKSFVQETNILHVNSDLVVEIGFLPNSEQPSVTHTESIRQTVQEAERTNMLHTRCDNESIGVSDNEIDSRTDTIQNIEEYALPEIPGVDYPMYSGNNLSIINFAVYNAKLISYELFMNTNFIGLKLAREFETTLPENRLNTKVSFFFLISSEETYPIIHVIFIQTLNYISIRMI